MDESELLQNGSRVREEEAYKKIKVLGEGSMGKAYLVECKADHQLYVMKRINIGHLSPEQKQCAMRQAQLHSIVQHANIIAFKQIYHTTKDKLCIIMEYAQNGDLDQFIQDQNGKPLNQEVVLHYFTQICLGLKEIHSKKIIHRDLKGANIFLAKDMTVKIGDFGISKIIDQTIQASKSFVGTPYYLSPEMVEGKPYSTKADIWALGVLLYHMCSQKLPFEANSLPLLALRILKGSFPPLTGPYSKELKALILSMLQVDAKKRPTAIDILNKPLLAKHIPQEEALKLEALRQKPPMPKKSTVGNLSNPNLIVTSAKPVKKSNKPKLSQQQRRQKEKDIKEEKKKKRDEQIKQMRDDIRKKRMEVQKQKLGSTKALDNALSPDQIPASSKITSKKQIEVQKSPNKQPIMKPWKTAKNKGGSKKQVQFEILVPSVKSRQIKKQPEIVVPSDFKIEIKQYGRKPVSTPDIITHQNAQQASVQETEIGHEEESDGSYYESVEEPREEEESQEVDFAKMMSHLNHAQEAVRGLKPNGGKQIQLYEESENFDDNNQRDKMELAKKAQGPQLAQMNTMEEHSWNFIQNSDNLEECRQILEEGLGQQRFMRAYQILNEHLDISEQKKMRGEELEDYTFNREVLRKKLDFLTDKQFSDYVVLMYTLIVIELQEMKKNLDDDT